ncbi:hypothetical protein [Saccharopolyspora sp. NPDC049357]|uniref:hypothetical protein n=1 Tax=Saccharopolyspora sp. NPDC049357 TaxID=3154507 RepID=UPI003413A3CE
MSTLLSTASRICIIVLVLGGAAVTFTQVAGIALGDPEVVMFAGTALLDPVCVIAGFAGIFAYLRTYTRAGKAEAESQDARTGDA